MEGLLKCKSCSQSFDLESRRPKFLVCHHCFCVQCVQSLLVTSTKVNNQTVSCPTCRKVTCIARNGVAALPDNHYLLPRLEEQEGSSDEGEAPAPMAVKIFCETCLKVASPSCLTRHRISNYEQGVDALRARFEKALGVAGERLSDEVRFLEENCKYLERVQKCWVALGDQLHHSVITHTMSLTSARCQLDKLPEMESPAVDPTVLARVVLDTEQTLADSANRLADTKNLADIWRALSKCNVNIRTPSLPPDCVTFPVELHERTKDDLTCLAFALSKIIEARIKEAENEQPQIRVVTKVVRPISSGVVCCYFDLTQADANLGRIVFEINCKAAPKMAKNFIELCTGEHGYGFANTKLWKNSFGDHIDGGDLPEGGDCSVYDRKPFYGDSSNLPDGLGMLRMRGRGTSKTGQPIVGSQFMVWIKQRSFRNYSRTLVFGRVKEGIELLADMPETKSTRKGKPLFTPPVSIANCGILK